MAESGADSRTAELLADAKSLEAFLADADSKADQLLQLLPWKQDCAADRIKTDFKKLVDLLAEKEQQTKLSFIREADNHKALIESIRSSTRAKSAALRDCLTALQSGDASAKEAAVRQVVALKSEFSQRPVAVAEALQSLQTLDAVGGGAFVQLEAMLRAPALHYFKLCALAPADVTLSLISERNSVGQHVQIEIRPATNDARFKQFLGFNVEDAEKNVVGHRITDQATDGGLQVLILQFFPTLAGRYRVAVTLYGEQVRGSPLMTLVSTAVSPRMQPVANGLSTTADSLLSAADSDLALNTDGQTARGGVALRRGTGAMARGGLRQTAAPRTDYNLAKNLRNPWEDVGTPPAPPDAGRVSSSPVTPAQSSETVEEAQAVLLPGLPAPPPPPPSTQRAARQPIEAGMAAMSVGRGGASAAGRGFLSGIHSVRAPPPLTATRAVADCWDESIDVVVMVDSESESRLPEVEPLIADVAAEAVCAAAAARINLADLLASGANGIRGEKVFVLGQLDASEPPERNFSSPIGCIRSERNGAWIVCDTKHDLVKMFSSDGVPLRCVGQDFVQPSALAMLPGGRQVAVKDRQRIGVYDLETDALCYMFERTYMPYGLAYDYDGTELLCTLVDGARGAKAEVVFLDPRAPADGPVRRHAYPTLARLDTAAVGASKPRFLDCRGGVLAVSDLGVQKVAVARSADGAPIGTLGGRGRLAGSFAFVSGVSIDGGGNFLIGDCNTDRVQLFDRDGQFKCVVDLQQPGAMSNSDVHLTDDGHLITTSLRNHIVPVFKLTA